MNLRRLFLISSLIISVSIVNAIGRSVPEKARHLKLGHWGTPAKNNVVEFDLSYNFYVRGETSRISFIVNLPQSIPDRQEIQSIKYSRKPSRIFHQNGNRYAEFVIINPDRYIEIKISIKAELFRYDLLTAQEKYKNYQSQDSGFTEFLKQEENIEKDHEQIQRIAESIKGQTETEIVKKTYDYVIDNLDYIVNGSKVLGAVGALEQGKGDCSEYSDLFVTLCRAKNIPARVATGYTVRADADKSKHNWAEVYLQQFGWVPFDPSWGDMKNVAIRNKVFSRLRPVYIYFSHIRNDEVLRNYQFFRYTYRGERVKFSDSIEFKQPDISTLDTH